MRILTTAVALLAIAGCYNPKIPNGTQLCGPNATCANGYVCGNDGKCYLNGMQPHQAVPDEAVLGDMAVALSCVQTGCDGGLCDPTSGLCVQCLMDAQCPSGQLCKSGACAAGCSMDHGCGTSGICDVDAGVCQVCHTDGDCNGSTPRCDTGSGLCVICLTTSDNCANGSYCVKSNNNTYACMMGCKIDNDCNQKVAPPPQTDGGLGDGGLGDGGDGGGTDGGGVVVAMDGGVTVVMTTLTCCNHVCVDTTADNSNCGKCGTSCNQGDTCCGSSCTNTVDDIFNCGTCGTFCGGNHANWTCQASLCSITACDGTFHDCNMQTNDGCEANIVADPNNCGGCGMACSVPNAIPICAQTCLVGTCNAGFANCNRQDGDGCEIDTTSDPKNCGSCGHSCGTPNNATAACVNSLCVIASCNPGYGDCDGNPGNGCEANLNADANNCKACGTKCTVPPNGSAVCNAGTCGVSSCTAPFKTCVVANPCAINTNTDVNNCGSCGTVCPNVANGVKACNTGICGIAPNGCTSGFADCDNNSGNGCEINLNTDPNNCKSCGSKCIVPNGTPGCSAGTCTVASCSAGFKDCNNDFHDGCEINLNTDAKNCGACGMVCPAQAASCIAGKCAAVPPACVTAGNDPETNDPWVLCAADGMMAWVSHANANGGHYHALQICQSLGYSQLGQFGGTCSDVCGYCGQPTGTCAAPGPEKFDGGGSCGSDGNGMILCQTVQWQCLK